MKQSDTRNFAVLIDMENAGGKVAMLNTIIEKVKMRGDILIGRCYGYSEHYDNLKEVLLSNTFQAVPSLKHGSSQKNSLDIQLVIDALEVAFTNPLIDSFCIVSGDSDFVPLVGKLKSMGKFVMGISRSEVASQIFINACNEFVFLESAVSNRTKRGKAQRTNSEPSADTDDSLEDLEQVIDRILSEQTDENGLMYASEVKDTLLRLRPDFSERNYGQVSFGKLLRHLEKRFGRIKLVADSYALLVRSNIDEEEEQPLSSIGPRLTKENYVSVFADLFRRFKEDGFDRVNPSIVKAAVQSSYPDFDERQIGFRRFSDVIKDLEKEGMVRAEFNEAMTMIIRIL